MLSVALAETVRVPETVAPAVGVVIDPAGGAVSVNVAVTVGAALRGTVQVPVPEQPAPLQPLKVEPAAGAARRGTAGPPPERPPPGAPPGVSPGGPLHGPGPPPPFE